MEAVITMLQSIKKVLSSPYSSLSPKFTGLSKLSKLSLHVTHLCNLRCSYCYAQHGDYGLGARLMPAQVALAAIDMAFRKFRGIEIIQFFGGEPLLNLPVIAAVCEYVTQLAQTKSVPLPRFGLITNGTLYPKGLEEVVNRFKLHITVSLDGPKEINDLHRVFPNKKGTYDVIFANIKRLRERTGQPVAIEATITQDHVKRGYTKGQLMEFFSKEFGIKAFIIEPAWDLTEERIFDPYVPWWADFADESGEHPYGICGILGQDLFDGGELQDLIPLIVKAWSNLWCGAGISHLTITPTGDIFPCHLFLYHPEFKIGNVMDQSWDDSVVLRLRENSKLNTPKCRECEAKWMCRACIGGSLSIQGTINPSCSEAFCKAIKNRAERVLDGFVNLYLDSDTRRRVVTAIKNIIAPSCTT